MKHALRHYRGALAEKWTRDNVSNGAAALAFYFTLSIFPTLIVLLAVIPYLPIERVDQAIMDFLGQALPSQAASMLEGVVKDIATHRRGGLLTAGLLGTLWAASSGMVAVMRQLDVVYGVEESRSFVRIRSMALLLTVLFLTLVIGAFSIVVLGGVIQAYIGSRFGFGPELLTLFALLRWLIIVLALIVAFAVILHAGPDSAARFALFTPGTVAAALLLLGASLLFKVYVTNFGNYDAIYGSLGAVIILMLWLYIAGLVLMLAGEIDHLWRQERYGAQPGDLRAPNAQSMQRSLARF